MIVVDASVLVDVIFRHPITAAIERRFSEVQWSLHAPHLIDIEVAQVVRRHVRAGDLDPDRGRESLEVLVDFPVQRYAHPFLLPRIWELRHNLSAYDASYVALAEVLDMPLLTRDRRLATAAGAHAAIELV
jgi:predicted nucleic acid-binding protein